MREVVIGPGGKFIWINGLPMSPDLNSAAMSNPEMEFQGTTYLYYLKTSMN